MDARILGPLEVVDGDRVLTPARPKQRTLLAALLLRANDVVTTDELLDGLWSGHPPQTATTALHGHIAALRKLLGPSVIETRSPGYVLRLAREQTDLGRFEAFVDEARRESDPARKSERLRAALALFRGEPLAEFRYDTFFREDITRIDELRVVALEERFDAELALGHHAELVAELERLVSANPLRERLRGQLMVALYGAGRQVEALHVYQRGRLHLADDLGLEPGPVLKELERKILTHDQSLLSPRVEAIHRTAGIHRERKQVTVLVCDLLGFAERPTLSDPEDDDSLLAPALETVVATLERFGGTLETVMGHTVIAVFGAPSVHEDDPERAVRAALAIQHGASEGLELRLAVETGEALVIHDADRVSGERAVSGPVIAATLRLQAAAAPGAIIVGDNTRAATDRIVDYRPLDPIVVTTRQEPLHAWQVVGLRSTDEARLAGPFVGRRRELDQLNGALVRAERERASELVTILGAPGIGKSRLVRELYAVVEAQPNTVTWLEGRSPSYGDGATFWALGEIVKAQAGVFESDASETVEEKLRLTVNDTPIEESERPWVLRHLRALLGLGEGQTRGDGRSEQFLAWCRFFEALADDAPLVLVFEDLHWADDGMLDFADELAASVTGVPILVVVTSRPRLLERRPSWGGGKRNAATITLAPLSQNETEELFVALTGGAVAPELIERAEGNPLFAEEYARLVADGSSPTGQSIPASLHSLISARVDALTSEEKAVLQDAAVVGEVSWVGAIAAMGQRTNHDVVELAAVLQHKDLLRRQRRSSMEGETEYAFAHVLVRDVTYGQIPRHERGMKHRRVAEWLNTHGRREDNAELVAHHFERALEFARLAGEPTVDLQQRASVALGDAGDHAAALGALPRAVSFYRQALAVQPGKDHERGKLLLRLGRALVYTEIVGEDELLSASAILEEVGDELGMAQAEALLVTLYQEEGRGELVRRHLERVTALATPLPPSIEKGAVLAEICRSRMMSGDHEETLRTAAEALVLCDELRLEEIRATVLSCTGPVRLVLGDGPGAIADLDRAIAAAEAVGSHEVAHGFGNLSEVLFALGDLAGSYRARRAGAEHSRQHGVRWYHRWASIQELNELYFTRCDWDLLMVRADELTHETTIIALPARDYRTRIRVARDDGAGAVVEAEQMLELARRSGDTQALQLALPAAALAALASDEHAQCSELIDEYLATMSWTSPFTQSAAPTLGVMLHDLGRGTELAARIDGVGATTPWLEAGIASARGHFAEAATIYQRVGDRPDEAYSRLRAAEQLTATGHSALAREQLHRALGFFRSVDATAYVRRGERLATIE